MSWSFKDIPCHGPPVLIYLRRKGEREGSVLIKRTGERLVKRLDRPKGGT